MSTMTSRERILAACRRQMPDRVPRHITFEGVVQRALRERLGTEDLAAYFKIDNYFIGPNSSTVAPDYSGYFTREGVTWDDWGCGRIWDANNQYAEYLYPLENAESVDEVEQFPWPDLDAPYRYDGMTARVAEMHAQGKGVSGALGEVCFEIAWQLRSMDRLFEDILTEDPMATVLMDKIVDRKVVLARELAKADVDILMCGDDVAMQTGLMMSREMFNRWFRPRLERIITAAREIKPDILVWYHSDGKLNDLVPDLVDAGIDILNPVQPECMDHQWVKSNFGDRIAFACGLGVQSVLPFGSPDEVRRHVREVIGTLGAGGGLIIGPSHVLERDVPIDNILAMAEAMDEFGQYR